VVKVADRVPKPTENVDLHLGEAFDAFMHVSLYRHPDAVNAFQELEASPQGRRRGRLGELVRHGLLVRGSWLAKSALRHGVDQQREGHHHQQSFNAAMLFDKHRRDKNRGSLSNRKPPSPRDWLV
jgi:hypothetical protein